MRVDENQPISCGVNEIYIKFDGVPQSSFNFPCLHPVIVFSFLSGGVPPFLG